MPQGVDPVENPDIRAQLMAEIEALVAHDVFGLTRDELRYVLDPDNLLGEGSGLETFKALRNREKRQLGEYRKAELAGGEAELKALQRHAFGIVEPESR